MINTNKCQTCYPIIAKIFEVKFEGEKELRKCIMRAWRECDQPAVEHREEYLDPNRPETKMVFHRCAIHVEEARLLHEFLENNKQE